MITHLTYSRIKTLLEDEVGYAAAIEQAERELVTAIGIGPPGLLDGDESGTDVSVLSQDTLKDAYGLALGAVLLRSAEISEGSFDAEFQQQLNQIQSDLADDGLLNESSGFSVTLNLKQAERDVSAPVIAFHLARRVKLIGPDRNLDDDPLPNINRILDSDHDGRINVDDNCVRVDNLDQQDIDNDEVGDVRARRHAGLLVNQEWDTLTMA